MTNQELIEYLTTFPVNSEAHFIIADVKARKKYDIENTIALTDAGCPVICFEITGGVDFDEEEKKTAELC